MEIWRLYPVYRDADTSPDEYQHFIHKSDGRKELDKMRATWARACVRETIRAMAQDIPDILFEEHTEENGALLVCCVEKYTKHYGDTLVLEPIELIEGDEPHHIINMMEFLGFL